MYKCVLFFTIESRFKEKHSLDSDEEDEDDNKEESETGLDDEDLAAQEDTTIVSYNNMHLSLSPLSLSLSPSPPPLSLSLYLSSLSSVCLFSTQTYDGDIKVTPFNLQEEMEEGLVLNRCTATL